MTCSSYDGDHFLSAFLAVGIGMLLCLEWQWLYLRLRMQDFKLFVITSDLLLGVLFVMFSVCSIYDGNNHASVLSVDALRHVPFTMVIIKPPF